MKTFALRPYQRDLARAGLDILSERGLLYMAMEMRVGKTLIAFEIAKKMKAKSVLFVTKKKAIGSIRGDYLMAGHTFTLHVVNYESLHKVDHLAPWNLIIADEAHSLGAFPRPTKRARDLKKIVGNVPYILMSGTPSPESYSQLYHQLWVSEKSPWKEHKNFYEWVRSGYVRTRQFKVSGYMITDYSGADKEKIDADMAGLVLTFTQEQADFKVVLLTDKVVSIPPPAGIKKFVDILVRDRIYTFKAGEVVVADSAVNLQNKVHQAWSGTIITDKGVVQLDDYKVRYIKEHYKEKRIAIFYLFVGEGYMLMEHFPHWTTSPEKFKADWKTTFISQFQSGSRGINLSCADVIIFLNIHFSSELYQQARQRGQEKDKTSQTEVHWIFAEGGIEHEVYKRVINKQDYTLSYFREDYL